MAAASRNNSGAVDASAPGAALEISITPTAWTSAASVRVRNPSGGVFTTMNPTMAMASTSPPTHGSGT